MSLICFRNGSLLRDQLRESHGMNWQEVSDALLSEELVRPVLPYAEEEITPKVAARTGLWQELQNDAPAKAIQALVLGQILNIWHHSQWTGKREQLLLTGGAAVNKGLQQLFADVFQCRVIRTSVSDSAALGAALRALCYWHTFCGTGADPFGPGTQRLPWRDVKRFLASGAPVGEYLADQLLLPMALAGGGEFLTSELSQHTETNAEVIRRFLGTEISWQRQGKNWLIHVKGEPVAV